MIWSTNFWSTIKIGLWNVVCSTTSFKRFFCRLILSCISAWRSLVLRQKNFNWERSNKVDHDAGQFAKKTKFICLFCPCVARLCQTKRKWLLFSPMFKGNNRFLNGRLPNWALCSYWYTESYRNLMFFWTEIVFRHFCFRIVEGYWCLFCIFRQCAFLDGQLNTMNKDLLECCLV